MKNIYGSDWQFNTVEIMKTLHGYEKQDYNDKIECIDLQTEENDSKKLLRVLVDEKQKSQPIYVKTVNQTLQSLKEDDIDKALIIGKRATRASRRLLNENENLDYLTPEINPHYHLTELLYAVKDLTKELCRVKCGKVPHSESDCKGHTDRNYTCDVRRVSDDATFHAEMKWNTVLHEDIDKLIKMKQELDS